MFTTISVRPPLKQIFKEEALRLIIQFPEIMRPVESSWKVNISRTQRYLCIYYRITR